MVTPTTFAIAYFIGQLFLRRFVTIKLKFTNQVLNSNLFYRYSPASSQ
jgi:hypothetical protein